MGTLNGITFEHLHEGSGQGRIDDKGKVEIVEKYLVDYSSVQTFMSGLRGSWASVGGTQVQFSRPDAHHLFTALYCLQATFEPVGQPSVSGEYLTWDKAVVTATYGPPTFNPNAQDVKDVAEESLEFGARILQLPSGSTKDATGSSGKPILDGVTKMIPTAQYTLTLQGVPVPPGASEDAPFSQIFSSIGKVNAAAWKGAAAETMLFMGANAKRSINSEGVQDWTLTYVFKYDPDGWNTVYANTGQRVTAYATGDESKLYTTTDFEALLPGYD
jgi:hypothetical protein